MPRASEVLKRRRRVEKTAPLTLIADCRRWRASESIFFAACFSIGAANSWRAGAFALTIKRTGERASERERARALNDGAKTARVRALVFIRRRHRRRALTKNSIDVSTSARVHARARQREHQLILYCLNA